MKGFFLGLLVAALAFGGYLFWQHSQGPSSGGPVAQADAGAGNKKKRKRRGRGAQRLARGKAEGAAARSPAERPAELEAEELEPEPPTIKLSAADLRSQAQGDDLGRPDVVRLDLGEGGADLPELSQDEIDARFRAQEEAILGCISRARPDPEVYVPGLVSVKFRIQRAGTVRGVRVEAPAVLQRGGLYACVKQVVSGIRFPASGGSQIVTYPFRLS